MPQTMQAPGLRVPEDIARLIVDEILSYGDRSALHTVALLSSSFLYVAHCHLYRSYTLNLRDHHALRNLLYFLDLLRRRPYIKTFVKEFKIVDHFPNEYIPQYPTVLDRVNDATDAVPTYVMQDPLHHQLTVFLELFILNKHGLLPQLLSALPCLKSASLFLRHGFLDWSMAHIEVQHAMQGLLESEGLRVIRLSGVFNIPESLSSKLLVLDYVDVKNCHFASSHPLFPLQFQHLPITLPKNRIECMSLAGKDFGGLARVVGYWRSHRMEIPDVERLILSVTGWNGAWDNAFMLGAFGNVVKELTLSTIGLELGFVQKQPPSYPTIHSFRLPHLPDHGEGDCFSEEEDPLSILLQKQLQLQQNPPIDKPGWFLDVMRPLRPAMQPTFNKLRKVSFVISHWRSAYTLEENGELFWVANWLADLPSASSRDIKHISIDIRVGADFCMDNLVAMQELVSYNGWNSFDLALIHPMWKSLETVSITARSRTSCVYRGEEECVLMMAAIQEKLHRLHARRLVEVHYIPLGNKSEMAQTTE